MSDVLRIVSAYQYCKLFSGDIYPSEKPFAFRISPSNSFYQKSSSLRRRKYERLVIGLFTLLVLLAYRWYGPRTDSLFSYSLPCRHLPGAHDAVVVMRTGVTQFEAALPVHLNTTMRCFPNSVIFSDHEELYQGQYEIRDVLANVNSIIQQENGDFELWRHVKAVGRQGLDPTELSGKRATSKTTKEDKIQIAGWVLDKWKFLPMLNET